MIKDSKDIKGVLKSAMVASPWMVPFISGVGAGCVDTVFNYPPYCLHYRLQRGEGLRVASIYTPRELYRGVLAYSAIIPITCICDGMTDYWTSHGVPQHLAAINSGMIAALLVSAPVGNAIVTNLRLKQEKRLAGTSNAVRHLYKTYGIKGFYTGVESLLIREATYSWCVFYAKNKIQDTFGWGDILSSVAAGTVGTIISQPCDTSATYAQNQVVRIPFTQTIRNMYAEGGIGRFYYGFVYRWYAVVAGIYVMDKVSSTIKDKLTF